MVRKGAVRRGKGTVRIVAGSWKGKAIKYPPHHSTRPTMQRAKASVFDSLGSRIKGALFVDLYCAAGAMGIEALSRGAAFVHFVESDEKAVAILEENLESCPVDGSRFAVHHADALSFMGSVRGEEMEGAIIYADPPYESDHAKRLIQLVSSRNLQGLGMLLIEVFKEIPPWEGSGLVLARTLRFGQSIVCFFMPEGR